MYKYTIMFRQRQREKPREFVTEAEGAREALKKLEQQKGMIFSYRITNVERIKKCLKI